MPVKCNAARLAPFAAAAYPKSRFGPYVCDSVDAAGGSWQRRSIANVDYLHVTINNQEIVAIAGTQAEDKKLRPKWSNLFGLLSRDWRNNIDFASIDLQEFCDDNGFPINAKHRGVRVHTGFITHAGLVADDLRTITDFSAPFSYVIGHSLGGVVAHWLPALFDNWLPRVYSYGAPRSFRPTKDHKKFAAEWSIVRTCRNWDAVPLLPRILYRHPSSIYQLLRYTGSVRSRRTWLSWATLPLLLLSPNPLQTLIDAHSMERYIDELRPLRCGTY